MALEKLNPMMECDFAFQFQTTLTKKYMIALIQPMFAAIGFSLLYLLLGGGLGGAFLIFIVAKMFGK